MKLSVRAIDGPLGAIVTGWDPSEKLGNTTRAQIIDLLQQHVVLVFRGNRQPEDSELVKGHEFFHDNGDYSGEYSEILPVNNVVDGNDVPQGTAGSMQLGWHCDYSYASSLAKKAF